MLLCSYHMRDKNIHPHLTSSRVHIIVPIDVTKPVESFYSQSQNMEKILPVLIDRENRVPCIPVGDKEGEEG